MPNAILSVYFNDEDYIIYQKKKEELNQKAREYLKRLVRNLK